MDTSIFTSLIGSESDWKDNSTNDYYKVNKYGRTRYCGKCNTRREHWMEFQGEYRAMPIMCKCRTAEVEARDRQRGEDALEGFRKRCLKDEALISKRFDTSNMFAEMERCKAYADSFKDFEVNGTGLLLWGATGNGKTHAAACIANALIDKHIPVAVTSFPKILQGGFNKDELLDELRKARLVIIDDLGAERQTQYSLETVFLVIDELYLSKKPMIVTSNLSLNKMVNPPDLEHKRIYDRLLERCIDVFFPSVSQREKTAKTQLEKDRQRLQAAVETAAKLKGE